MNKNVLYLATILYASLYATINYATILYVTILYTLYFNKLLEEQCEISKDY